MNDPWDVKSVLRGGQYVSCMKINGVPLLPPVLSKECREEMQYYKLLAKEVEKRFANTLSLINNESYKEDKTDALEQTDVSSELSPKDGKGVELNVHKVIALTPTQKSPQVSTLNDTGSGISNVKSVNKSHDSSGAQSKLIIDFSLNIKNNNNSPDGLKHTSLQCSPVNEQPERDYNCLMKPKQGLQNDFHKKQRSLIDNITSYLNNSSKTKPILHTSPQYNSGPSSLSAKSFTGSLNDIYTESIKESQKQPKLIRQRSYTVLQPSPQLLAHLENESLNTGVAMASISMSDSLSNMTTPNKKRRNWDLQSAKEKWSLMALELKQKQIGKCLNFNVAHKNINDKSSGKIIPQDSNTSQRKSKSLSQERPKQPLKQTSVEKSTCKSDPIQRPRPHSFVKSSPLPRMDTFILKSVNHNIETAPSKPAQKNQQQELLTSTKIISESEDPATKVRELYEKIQRQQLVQMASLVEKQKREQMLLQNVFEEQNNMLYKQLEIICPKSPIEVRKAWGENTDPGRGPVSLNQLINHKTPEKCAATPVTATLTETNDYIILADDVLKKSRNISSTLKKQQTISQESADIQSPRSSVDGSRTRTHSPVYRVMTCRKLNYDTSASSDREYEAMLTDRTNDTLADLNVTFPSDNSDDNQSYNNQSQLCNNNLTVIQRNTLNPCIRSTDSAIRCMEQSILHSINNVCCIPQMDTGPFRCEPTAKELHASSVIVAYAKGYLVRRLMKTERVQGTVQTIRDALLCALQLHQDREGIRGADVDLHRRLIQQLHASSVIVAYAKGYLVRRLMKTERVQGTVQTIRDALLCALQLHQDREGIRGADVDLHRRLIQQITAACYTLHDTFITSTSQERCAIIATDRKRWRSVASRDTSSKSFKTTDL